MRIDPVVYPKIRIHNTRTCLYGEHSLVKF